MRFLTQFYSLIAFMLEDNPWRDIIFKPKKFVKQQSHDGGLLVFLLFFKVSLEEMPWLSLEGDPLPKLAMCRTNAHLPQLFPAELQDERISVLCCSGDERTIMSI